eukprot:102940-Rhodomonas_salina.2
MRETRGSRSARSRKGGGMRRMGGGMRRSRRRYTEMRALKRRGSLWGPGRFRSTAHRIAAYASAVPTLRELSTACRIAAYASCMSHSTLRELSTASYAS